MNQDARPFGSWISPITAEMVAAKGTRLGHMQTFSNKLYWLESRPQEKGRGVIVEWNGREKRDITPEHFSVRTKVHEYGGGDFVVFEKGILFSNDADQRIYWQSVDGNCEVLTVEGPDKDWRYADMTVSPDGRWLYAVRERHEKNVINELIQIDLENKEHAAKVIAEGADFYSFPRVSPGGHRMCWTSWSHPQMPWDGTELWVADVQANGDVSAAHKVCGGPDESVYQPSWSPDGVLHFVSDRSGWWNLYSFRDGVLNALTPTDHDFGLPQWIFGTSTYCFGEGDNIYATFFEEGQQQIAHINTESGHIEPIALPFREYPSHIHYSANQLFVIAGAPLIPLGIYQIDLTNHDFHCLEQPNQQLPVTQDFISVAKPVSFTSSAGYQAHAYFYPPAHPEMKGLENEKPPLIVMSHGGPTAAATTTLDWGIQFWTSRGFAVVDVNYGGSTGFGREYREYLNGHWGIEDVNDCVYAARYLVENNWVDPERLLIRGGSAGGFTTLCALTFFDDFAAGMSRYGVADLEALASDSHKFEIRYLDNLVGPYPEHKEQYIERSPIHHTDELSCPILVLQGSEDKVVPPSQSQQLVKALSDKDIPHAYIEFEGEAHGFRKKENIITAFESELGFYRKVLNIASDEKLCDLTIEGMT